MRNPLKFGIRQPSVRDLVRFPPQTGIGKWERFAGPDMCENLQVRDDFVKGVAALLESAYNTWTAESRGEIHAKGFPCGDPGALGLLGSTPSG